MAQMNDKNIKQLLDTLDESLPPQVNFDTETFWQQLQPQIAPKKRTYWGYGIAASLLLMLISVGIWVSQNPPTTVQLSATSTPPKPSNLQKSLKISSEKPILVSKVKSKKKHVLPTPSVAKIQDETSTISTPLVPSAPILELEKTILPSPDSNRVAATVENPPSTKVSSINPAKQRWKVVHANELQTDPMERIHEQISTKKRHSPSEYAQQTHLFTIKIK